MNMNIEELSNWIMLEYPSIAALAEKEMSNPLDELINPGFVLTQQIKRAFFEQASEEEKNAAFQHICGYIVGFTLRKRHAGQNSMYIANDLLHELGEASRAAQREYEAEQGSSVYHKPDDPR